MLAYKECLPCPPAPPLDTLSDVQVKVIDPVEKAPRVRPSRPAPAPPAAAPAEEAGPPPAPVEVAAPAPEVPHPEPQRAAPHPEVAHHVAHKPAAGPAVAGGRTRSLMILLVIAALAFAGTRLYLRSASQLSQEDVSQQLKSNAQMIRLSVVSYFQSRKKYPTSPEDVLGILKERHVNLTSPFTGQPIKVVAPGSDAAPGDALYESDGTHYKIRVAGRDKNPWTENGQELVISDSR